MGHWLVCGCFRGMMINTYCVDHRGEDRSAEATTEPMTIEDVHIGMWEMESFDFRTP